MNKADLIKWLEPFEDDIKILIQPPDTALAEMRGFNPAYDVRSSHLRLFNGQEIEKGEGYIALRMER